MSSILMMRIKIVDRSVRAERYGDRFLFFSFFPSISDVD